MSRTRFGSRLKKAISAWPRPRARHARAARQRGGLGTASASAVREARAGRGRAGGGEGDLDVLLHLLDVAVRKRRACERDAACPISTGGGTRRVHLVRGGGA